MKVRYVVLGLAIGAGVVGWLYQDRLLDAAIRYVEEADDSEGGLPVPGSPEWSAALKDIIEKQGMGHFVASVAEAARKNQARPVDDDLCMEHAEPLGDCAPLHAGSDSTL